MLLNISVEEDVRKNGAYKATIFQFSYGIPAVFSMIFLVIYFFFSKKYKKSFYFLIQIDLIVNILLTMNSWLSLRMTHLESGVDFMKWIENKIPGVLDWSTHFLYVFFHLQFCTAFALNVYRILALFFTKRNEPKWILSSFLFFLAALTYSMALPFLLPGAFSYRLSIENENKTLIGIYDTVLGEKKAFGSACFSVIYFLAFLAIGLLTRILVRLRVEKIKILLSPEISRQVTKIAFANSIVFLGIMSYSIFSGFVVEHICETVSFFCKYDSIIATFSSDMMTVFLPINIIFHDPELWKEVCKLRRKLVVVAAPVTEYLSRLFNVSRS